MGGEQVVVFDQEDVGGVGFRDIAVDVQHDGVVHARHVGFDFGQDVVDQVVVVDLRVDALGGIAADGGGDQADAGGRVDRRFPLGKHDQAGAVPVQVRAHAGGDFFAPGQGEADVDAVPHAVGFQGFEDRRFDFLTAGDLIERHCVCRVEEAVQVGVELKDLSIVDAQSLPYRIAALYRAVEYRYSGFLPGQQFASYMDEDVLVARIGQLY